MLAAISLVVSSWVAIYATTLGPQNNLPAERIRLIGKMQSSSDLYGWGTGAYVKKPDRGAFSTKDLDSGGGEKIMLLYDQAEEDLSTMALVLPAELENDIAGLRYRLIRCRRRSKMAIFKTLPRALTSVCRPRFFRGKMRVFLGANPGE
jgi:hypothetical protein